MSRSRTHGINAQMVIPEVPTLVEQGSWHVKLVRNAPIETINGRAYRGGNGRSGRQHGACSESTESGQIYS